MCTVPAAKADLDPETLCLDGRFNHFNQLQNRLDFVRFSLKDGQLWLGHQQALVVRTAVDYMCVVLRNGVF